MANLDILCSCHINMQCPFFLETDQTSSIITSFLRPIPRRQFAKVLIHPDRHLSILFQSEQGIAFQDIHVIMFCVAETVILLIHDFICLTDRWTSREKSGTVNSVAREFIGHQNLLECSGGNIRCRWKSCGRSSTIYGRSCFLYRLYNR